MPIERFEDLPQVRDDGDMRRVHQTSGLYFLNQSGVAHADLSCMFLDGVKLVASPRWRVASDAECRAVGGSWCVDCCSAEY